MTAATAGTLATIHPGHVILVSPAVEGKCSFYSGDHAEMTAVEAEFCNGNCGQPATTTAVGANGLVAELCPHHAAHVLACAKCRRDVVSLTAVAE